MKLIHIRLAFVLLGFFFFAISGVILISAYAKAENLNGVFSVERMVVLVCGLVHLVLAIPLYVSLHYTTKILSYYLSQNDPLFVALWDLLGMENIDDGTSSKIDEESFLEATTPGEGIKTPWGGWFVSSTDLRWVLRLTKNGLKMDPKWTKNGLKVD